MRLVLTLSILTAGLISASAPAAMVVQGYDPKKHDRFYSGVDKAFIGQPFDWSGIGNTNGASAGGGWATMISPSYFVSAKHYAPGGSVTFYETNNSAGASHNYTIATGQQIAGSDLWLGKLTSPIPSAHNIATYPIAFAPSESAYIGQEIYTVGVPNRVGRNNIDEIGTATDGVTTGRVFEFDYDNGSVDNPSIGLGADESYLQDKDSGGPSLINVGGTLAVVGVHWYIWDSNDNAPGGIIGSGDTFIPHYISNLTTAMASSGETLSLAAIPEPTTGALQCP